VHWGRFHGLEVCVLYHILGSNTEDEEHSRLALYEIRDQRECATVASLPPPRRLQIKSHVTYAHVQ
jgi:hypothetical protein